MPATKDARSKFWFARLDGPRDFLRQKCMELAGQIDIVSCLSSYHVGSKKENPHCHVVFELNAQPQKQAVAVRLKKLFNIEKKSQYALDIWDGQRGAGAVSYLFHEETSETPVDLLVNKGFTDAELDDARAANNAVQRVVAINKEKASTKFVERACEVFKDGSPGTRELLEYMMKECQAGNLYWPGTFRAKQMIEEVQIKLCDVHDFRNLVDSFHEKMFR